MDVSRSSLGRRTLLGGLGAGAAAVLVGPAAPVQAASPAPADAGRWAGSRSDNGWVIGGPTAQHRIEGTDLVVTLAEGAPAAVLLHAVRRFSYEVDTLRAGDVSGVSTDRRVPSPERSNLLSGTALLVREGSFPRGTDGNLFPDQVAVLDDIVAEAGGVLGWGGHLDVPDQGLLYVVGGTGAARELAGRYAHVDRMNVAGGAGETDALEPSRRRATARALARGRG